MTKIKDMIKITKRKVYTVDPQTDVLEAIKIMAEHKIGSLFVVEDDRLLGIFTEKDVIKLIADEKELKNIPIKGVMNTKLIPVSPEDDIQSSMIKMTKNRVRYLPIMENCKFVGMISIGDLVKKEIEAMQSEIETLQRYITQ